jgi:cellulose biosynthesis protein BcsQ
MIIAVYNAKGGSGKTPIATNIAFDKNYLIGTNETFHIYDHLLEEGRVLTVDPEEKFPSFIKKDNLDVVFDLAGSLTPSAQSISSALEMADIVIIPIYNEWKSLNAGLNTIVQVQNYNQNIMVVATKLQKQTKDIFSTDWSSSEDFKNIRNQVHERFSVDIEVLPLRSSKVFDNIFEQKKSIKQFCKSSPLKAHTYRVVDEQFDEIYKSMGV